MAWAVIILLSIIMGALAIRWFVQANPASLARGIRLGAVLLAVAVVLAMVATGRLPWLLGVIAPLAPLILAILARRRQRRRPAADWDASGGQQSTVTTDFLDMTFDHDSGALDGRVTAGASAGMMLSDMSLDELRALLQDVLEAGDTQSSSVLASYLDRTFGDEWHDGAGAGQQQARAPRNGAMTRDEALRVLGLPAGATEAEVRAAHRRLMKQAHPDHGGSDYLASKINEAKDVLLGG
ncbi:MAG: molecular chaperone DnaJ [Pseudomonadota bacterium]